MKIRTVGRIVADLSSRGAQHSYWEGSRLGRRLVRLARRSNRSFRRRVTWDLVQYLLNGPAPIRGETLDRARAAAAWLGRVQDAGRDDGASQGYFPCDEVGGWRPSYPETTGYMISTLLEFASRYGDDVARQRALRMARWEIEVQMESGAVQAGTVRPPAEQEPAVFNTGMVLDGWCSAYQATGDGAFMKAAERAAAFLLEDLGEDGHFRSHGTHVTHHAIKTYNCLCAWALYRHGQYCGESRYRQAAVLTVEASLTEQVSNGWFKNNCLTQPEAPLLHTIGYALQGILEVGVLADRPDFVEATARGVHPILASMSPKGFLHGRFYSDWEPGSFSSCLTGSAQLAVVCYRLHQVTGSPGYRDAADRIVNYLKPLQALDSGDPGIDGALGGSFPLFGSYMPAGYPNWATKYLLDALMLQHALAAE
jgi:hypothetical protein